MTPALLQFVRACLDEDERIAKGHNQWSPSWHQDDMANEIRDDENAGTVAFVPCPGDQAHIARHDPARVLREVAVKRQLLAIHRRYVEEPGQACRGCAGGIAWEACPVVRLLASPYSDRPDYREEWRP
ncbi:DUF6221 family protein [Streptomyces sp. H27-G5]|uniref:DUF6221 family protein n=1 Tax=Streptomyces sp. H27-G5 TaxID=2996698 RepID=UPI00226EC07D|nr:DUF6221 family protein [Streptomyces sp. H27-G5]MCY0917030.1 DUF6221 family protein [Streptomyces sp. H27-G5]